MQLLLGVRRFWLTDRHAYYVIRTFNPSVKDSLGPAPRLGDPVRVAFVECHGILMTASRRTLTVLFMLPARKAFALLADHPQTEPPAPLR